MKKYFAIIIIASIPLLVLTARSAKRAFDQHPQKTFGNPVSAAQQTLNKISSRTTQDKFYLDALQDATAKPFTPADIDPPQPPHTVDKISNQWNRLGVLSQNLTDRAKLGPPTGKESIKLKNALDQAKAGCAAPIETLSVNCLKQLVSASKPLVVYLKNYRAKLNKLKNQLEDAHANKSFSGTENLLNLLNDELDRVTKEVSPLETKQNAWLNILNIRIANRQFLDKNIAEMNSGQLGSAQYTQMAKDLTNPINIKPPRPSDFDSVYERCIRLRDASRVFEQAKAMRGVDRLMLAKLKEQVGILGQFKGKTENALRRNCDQIHNFLQETLADEQIDALQVDEICDWPAAIQKILAPFSRPDDRQALAIKQRVQGKVKDKLLFKLKNVFQKQVVPPNIDNKQYIQLESKRIIEGFFRMQPKTYFHFGTKAKMIANPNNPEEVFNKEETVIAPTELKPIVLANDFNGSLGELLANIQSKTNWEGFHKQLIILQASLLEYQKNGGTLNIGNILVDFRPEIVMTENVLGCWEEIAPLINARP